MPELPEVETTVNFLKEKILGKKIKEVFVEAKEIIKKPKIETFKKIIKGKQIKDIQRKGKNILFFLSKDYILLFHLKLTGHLLLGKWKKEKGKWVSLKEGPLKEDPLNKFLRVIFILNDGKMLALSDLRKFAKIELAKKKEILKELEKLGPDPLEISFEEFKKRIQKRKKSEIKKVLMQQEVISGIGNIYSVEALWEAKISPFRKVKDLSENELKKLFQSIKKILKEAIKLQGESISDWRKPNGEKGNYDKIRRVYRKEGEKCQRCGKEILKKTQGQRSTYFCANCQK